MYRRGIEGSFWRGFVAGLVVGLILAVNTWIMGPPMQFDPIDLAGRALLIVAFGLVFGAANWMIHRFVGRGRIS